MVERGLAGKSAGIDEARARLGQMADEIALDGQPVILTRRGRTVAVLLSPEDYEQLLEGRRQAARAELAILLPRLRATIAAAGLDEAVVDEAIAAARAAG